MEFKTELEGIWEITSMTNILELKKKRDNVDLCYHLIFMSSSLGNSVCRWLSTNGYKTNPQTVWWAPAITNQKQEKYGKLPNQYEATVRIY